MWRRRLNRRRRLYGARCLINFLVVAVVSIRLLLLELLIVCHLLQNELLLLDGELPENVLLLFRSKLSNLVGDGGKLQVWRDLLLRLSLLKKM